MCSAANIMVTGITGRRSTTRTSSMAITLSLPVIGLPSGGRGRSVSEVALGAHLDDAGCDALHAATDGAVGLRADGAVHRTRLGVEMVEQVEELGAELQRAGF